MISPDDMTDKKNSSNLLLLHIAADRSVERYERMIQSRKILFDVLQQPLFDVKI